MGQTFIQKYLNELFEQTKAQFGEYLWFFSNEIEKLIYDQTAKDPSKTWDPDDLEELITGVASDYMNRSGFVPFSLKKWFGDMLDKRKAKKLLRLAESWIAMAYKSGKAGSESHLGLRDLFEKKVFGKPLSPPDEWIIKAAERSTGAFLQPIVEGMGRDAAKWLLQNDKQATYRGVLDALQQKIHPLFEGEPHPKRLKGFLAGRAGHYMRDWERVARTEMAEAHAQGNLRRAISKHPSNRGKPEEKHEIPNELVFKMPATTACKYCRAIWKDGNVPRLFRLSQIISNGSNYGKPAKEWIATIGPIHPNCICGDLHFYTEGTPDIFLGVEKQLHRFPDQMKRFVELEEG